MVGDVTAERTLSALCGAGGGGEGLGHAVPKQHHLGHRQLRVLADAGLVAGSRLDRLRRAVEQTEPPLIILVSSVPL